MATKTLKIRIKDSSSCVVLSGIARAVNFVWNYCNETSLKALRYNSQWLSGFDLNKLCTGAGAELGLSATTVQEVGQEYATRRRQFKKKRLRWRGKKSLGWIPFKKTGIRFKDGEVKYLTHTFTVFQPERIPEKGTFGAGEFCQDRRGRWYLCVAIKYELAKTTAQGEVGIDLGLKDVASLSNGQKVSNNRYYRMMQNRLGHAQKNRKKGQVRSLHAKTRNKRLDELHKASTQIAEENNLIVVGKFGASKLAKTKMAKSIYDSATTIFKTMLKYKASARQCVYVEVNETNTTRTCSSCETIPASSPKGLKGLSVREWVCSGCGSVHDRDTNAALNILRLGHQTLGLK